MWSVVEGSLSKMIMFYWLGRKKGRLKDIMECLGVELILARVYRIVQKDRSGRNWTWKGNLKGFCGLGNFQAMFMGLLICTLPVFSTFNLISLARSNYARMRSNWLNGFIYLNCKSLWRLEVSELNKSWLFTWKISIIKVSTFQLKPLTLRAVNTLRLLTRRRDGSDSICLEENESMILCKR